MTNSTLNSATATVDEDRDSPTERHGVSDRGEDRETRVLPDEFEEVFEHLRSLTFFREASLTRDAGAGRLSREDVVGVVPMAAAKRYAVGAKPMIDAKPVRAEICPPNRMPSGGLTSLHVSDPLHGHEREQFSSASQFP